MTPLNGWIAIPRSVLTSEWYVRADAFTRALWLHLMLSANFAPSVTRAGLSLAPGQMVTSWNALADALSWHDREKHRVEKPTRSKVRRAAAFLRNAGEATYRPTGGPTHTGTVITLERWAFYASVHEASADAATDPTAGGVPEPRPHRKNTTGPVGPGESSTTINQLRLQVTDFDRRCRESQEEMARVRARERGVTVQ